MNLRILGPDDFSQKKWSGGITRELLIYPQSSSLEDRDFEFRISSASFTGEESDFSDFRGFQRYILPMEGWLKLDHQGLYKRELEKFQVEYFSGSFKTRSRNSLDCIDFNFIVRNQGDHLLQVLDAYGELEISRGQILVLYGPDGFELGLDESLELDGDHLVFMEASKKEKIRIWPGKSPVIACIYKKGGK